MTRKAPTSSGRPRPPLTVAQILAWADDHRARTGAWPGAASGPVAGAAGETWAALNVALRLGHRGLPGGDTLARLLTRERGAPPRLGRPRGPARRLPGRPAGGSKFGGSKDRSVSRNKD
jgi:hypothetical protein